MAKFRAGDRVKIIKACPGSKVGQIKIVTRNEYGTLEAGICQCQRKWELIKKPGRPIKPKPEVFKYIVVKSNDCLFETRRTLGLWLKDQDNPLDERVFEVKKELRVKTSFSLRKA